MPLVIVLLSMVNKPFLEYMPPPKLRATTGPNPFETELPDSVEFRSDTLPPSLNTAPPCPAPELPPAPAFPPMAELLKSVLEMI